ncbi:MAG: energy transducer TonB [Bacteroides sp.]|nr:energy transducer TonB [Bacteroidaceae bacterium]MBP3668300.1 energy transducer TonB [Bacteroides sp.]MBQ8602240.1 energy transducer TonB [Bacteroides sp.]
MKSWIFFCFFLLSALVAKGQEVEINHTTQSDSLAYVQEDSIYTKVDKEPEFVGGINMFMRYLAANLKYPHKAQKKKAEGRVLIRFIVEKDGSFTNMRVIRKVSPELDEEALRVLKEMPNWNPGIKDGKPVRVEHTVPIKFRLHEGKPNKYNPYSRKRRY